MPLAWLQDLFDALLEPDHLDLHIRFDHALTTTTPRLEGIIRDSLAANDHDRIAKIVHQLCHDYAYAVHQPHARNGGLIGLAAAAIALGGVRKTNFLCNPYPDTHNPDRMSLAIYEKSFLQFSPASPIKMPVYDTMLVRACTISQRSPKEKSSYTSTTSSMPCARYASHPFLPPLQCRAHLVIARCRHGIVCEEWCRTA